MACKHEIVKCERKVRNIVDDSENISDKINLTNLEENGMLQYFYHSPSSELPVRDILNEQKKRYKTEPHIEIGAENYISRCYPTNIKKFAESDEKYLFLVTTCRNRNINEYINKKTGEKKTNQFIVGYIIKDPNKSFYIDDHICIRGQTQIFSFSDSILMRKIFERNFDRPKFAHESSVDNDATRKIIQRFQNNKNILNECIREIKRLEDILEKHIKDKTPTAKGNKPPEIKDHTCKVKRKETCNFQNSGCLRWSIK
ncbi:MAG: hypothetical protein KKA10_00990 [Euryarchaeota archaeon]|nr:hypothetical protein [Euryarchaeota archaeon]